MGGSLITGNFPGKFEWCGPPNFNVPVPKTILKGRSWLQESHEDDDGSSPLVLNPWVISRCVLISPWTTGLASISFIPRRRES